MNDARLITLVAETDRYPATSPLPEDIAGAGAAFANIVAQLENETTPEPRHPNSGDGYTLSRWRIRRGALVALAAFLVVIATGAILFALSRTAAPDMADIPTTEAPVPTTATSTTSDTLPPQGSAVDDVAVAEAAIAAWYANDFETVSQLLDIPGDSMHGGWTPDDFRSQMAYDSAVGASVEGLDCSAPAEPGQFFRCRMTLRNALTDAIGLTTSELPVADTAMRVTDGRLSRYQFPDYQFVIESFGLYLALTGELDGFEECLNGVPLSTECAQIQLEHLDDWADWNRTTSAEELAQAHLNAMLAGECDAINVMTVNYQASGCQPAVLYETAVDGVLEVTECVAALRDVRCDGLYSNTLSSSVGAPAVSVSVQVDVGERQFGVWEATQFEGPHPEDEELLLSFRTWAQEAGLGDEVDEQCGLAIPRQTPECAAFLLNNLDAWAAWY